MNQNVNNRTRKPVSKNNKSKTVFTENWVKIRSIRNGIITLPNKMLVTGVKIEPKNIFILEQIQQDSIINSLKNCYNTMNFEFWLVVADRPVDISVYISQLTLMLNEQLTPAIRKMVQQDLEKANMFINNQVVDTEYYILFKDENQERLMNKLNIVINGFASCGLVCSQTSDDDLRIILDNFLNGGVRSNFGTVVLK